MPHMSPADAATQAACDLIHALENPSPTAPCNNLGTKKTAALRRLAKIFHIVQAPPIPSPSVDPAPTPRVIQDASHLRVNKNNVSPPRVPTTSPLLQPIIYDILDDTTVKTSNRTTSASMATTNQEQPFGGYPIVTTT